MNNQHLIQVKYLGPTNTSGSKVKLTSLRFPGDSLTMSYDYKYGNTLTQGIEVLKKLGYKLTGYGYDEIKGVYIITSTTFEPLKEQKGRLKMLAEKDKGWHKDYFNYNKAEKWERKPAQRKKPARNVKKTTTKRK